MLPTMENCVLLRTGRVSQLFALRKAFKIVGVSCQRQPGRMAAISGIILFESIFRRTVILHRIPAMLRPRVRQGVLERRNISLSRFSCAAPESSAGRHGKKGSGKCF